MDTSQKKIERSNAFKECSNCDTQFCFQINPFQVDLHTLTTLKDNDEIFPANCTKFYDGALPEVSPKLLIIIPQFYLRHTINVHMLIILHTHEIF